MRFIEQLFAISESFPLIIGLLRIVWCLDFLMCSCGFYFLFFGGFLCFSFVFEVMVSSLPAV